MKPNHNFYSSLAFSLAEKNLGKTNTNPSVGCVIVKNNSVISSAVTSIKGRPHAEFNALKHNINFKNSDMYVTLEPCTHYGLTPPCTNIIKKKKIKNVYYFFNDPDKRTHKKAKKSLKKIKQLNNVPTKFKKFYESYFLNQRQKFPFIDAKIAISKDYFTVNKQSKWITNHRSRRVGHLIRSKYDCIVSTSSSINKDNSLLNCRIDGLNNYKPDLIIIDRHLKLMNKLRLIKLSKNRKTYIFTLSNNLKKISFFKKKRIKIIKMNKLEDPNDFKKLFLKIFKLGNGRILVETGLKFLNQLLKFNYIKNLYIFKSSKFLKDKGINYSDINLIKTLKLRNKIKVNLDGDELFQIRIK